MKFSGTVVYAKRQDHEPPDNRNGGPVEVTDIRLAGEVSGHEVWVEFCVPTSTAKAYPIGRRVMIRVTPR